MYLWFSPTLSICFSSFFLCKDNLVSLVLAEAEVSS